MIRPNCRDQLTIEDFDFVSDILGKTASEKIAIQSLLADPENRDLILDNPLLFESIIVFPSKGVRVPFSEFLFFYILVRHQFLREEIPDPEISDYCASLLIHFIDIKKIPQRFVYLIDQLIRAQKATHREVFQIHSQIANYALFLSGMFPEYFESPHIRPSIEYYERIGGSSFLAASRHEIAISNGLAGVLEKLGLTFHSARITLNRVRKLFDLEEFLSKKTRE